MSTNVTPPAPEVKPKVTLEVTRDGWTKALQLSINFKGPQSGHGFRLAGPKFNGSSTDVLIVELDARAIAEIRNYLDLAEVQS